MALEPKKRGDSSGVEVSGRRVLASYTIDGTELLGHPVPDRAAPVRTGRVHSATADGPWVTWAGSHRPALARIAWMPAEPEWRACIGLPVLLAFADGSESTPVLIALLEAPPAPEAAAPATPSLPGVLRLESGRELIIECGKSRIHLRADGKIEIRGEYLISRATGPNKIKGGSVQIN